MTGVALAVMPSPSSFAVGARADARTRLLGELAGTPARKGYAIAYDLLRNRAEAEEAVQEALARACEAIDDLRDTDAATGWFLRIVTSMCLRTLRRRKLRRTLLGWLPGSSDTTSAPDVGASPAAAPTSADSAGEDIAARMHGEGLDAPRDAMIAREELTALLGRLDALSAQQRTALVLRYGHDLGVPEIAELLGVELATAKTHLVRGLARLRDLMEDHR